MEILLIPAAACAALAAVFAAYKASNWDPTEELSAVRKQERANAPRLVYLLTEHFDELAIDGLLTRASAARVGALKATDSDKELMRKTLDQPGPHTYVAMNPWLLGPTHEFEYTAIGHLIGNHSEVMIAPGSMGAAFPIQVQVDDYGISRIDLQSYLGKLARKAPVRR